MKLTVVGCSGSVPSAVSSASCYLIEHDGFRLVIDLGNGAFGSLQQYLRPNEIDAIALSHLHADHCIDMTALHVAYRVGGYPLRGLVPVYGPPDSGRRLAEAAGLDTGGVGLSSSCSFHDITTTTSIGPFQLRTARMAHPVHTNGIRLDVDATSFVFSGDTGPCPEIELLAMDADLLLAEAAFVDGDDNPPALHLTGKQAGQIANNANVTQLILTHIPPWNDSAQTLEEAKSSFGGTIELATPGMVKELGR